MPDLEVYSLQSFYRPSALRPIGGLLVDADKKVWYTVSAYVTIECPFVFDNYPMDRQNCSLRMGSFFHETDSVRFSGSFSYDPEEQRLLPYGFDVGDLPDGDEVAYYRAGTDDEERYSVYGVQLRMRREFQPFLVRFYIPSAVFVVVSWISFTVDPRVVPGRMALLVTVLLMLINMSTGLSGIIPLAKNLTAIEVNV